MKKDSRLEKLAQNIIKNSIKLQKGERVFIEAKGISTLPLMEEFVKAATLAGGVPHYSFNDDGLHKEFVTYATKEQMIAKAEIDKKIMESCDCYIGIRGSEDIFSSSDIPPEKQQDFSTLYYNPVHFGVRIPKTRWCIMRYPNASMSALSGMSQTQFEDFFFSSCLLDYSKMEKAMTPLVEIMKKTDKVHIKAPNTDLTFSIKNIPVIKCAGTVNIPDGEVFTAPVKDSINGYITFNTETMYNGIKFSNILLRFENGKIVEATSATNNNKLCDILDCDAGARFMGEFAFGVNPHINHPITDILFDEKISGSIHMAIGASYDDACNSNKSSIHWDLIQIQTDEYGGGEIYFDDTLIRKDGIFIIDELKCLNPENLEAVSK